MALGEERAAYIEVGVAEASLGEEASHHRADGISWNRCCRQRAEDRWVREVLVPTVRWCWDRHLKAFGRGGRSAGCAGPVGRARRPFERVEALEYLCDG